MRVFKLFLCFILGGLLLTSCEKEASNITSNINLAGTRWAINRGDTNLVLEFTESLVMLYTADTDYNLTNKGSVTSYYFDVLGALQLKGEINVQYVYNHSSVHNYIIKSIDAHDFPNSLSVPNQTEFNRFLPLKK